MKIKIEGIRDLFAKNNIFFDTNLKDDVILDSISSIATATSNSLIFLFNDKYLDSLQKCKAKCCVLKKEYLKYLPNDISHIIVDDPYLVFAYLSNLFSNKRSFTTISTLESYVLKFMNLIH